MDARSLVFGVQDRIHGWGRLVRTGSGDWFEPPIPVDLGWTGRLREPSRYAIPVDGADFDDVELRREIDDVLEGHTRIHGRWSGDRISIGRQTGDRPELDMPRWSEPPCPPPAGGWPRGTDEYGHLDFDGGDLEETGAAVSVVLFRPGPLQLVLVVAANDVAAVEAHLRPQLANRLCVVASRWTRAQLDEVQGHLGERWERWGVYTTGRTCDEQAQATVTAELVRVTDEIARWADPLPAGLLTLRPCLVPESEPA
jgi:hypothetical protein